jgi:phosphatidylethanolamine/phosphatidyl-N-methylethanolamine N-methyltransferase
VRAADDIAEGGARSGEAGRAAGVSRSSVVRAYRFYAPVYDWLFGALLEPGRRALGRAAGASRSARVLEVGIGTGLTLRYYPEDAIVTGIDLSEEMIELARRRLPGLNGRRVDLRRMDAESMQFPDEAFDCVALPYVLSVTPDPDRLCAEVRRVCRKGGTILVLNHFAGARGWGLLESAMRAAAQRVGFRSDISFEQQILARDWEVVSVRTVNLGGLSRLVEIRNT